MTVAGLSIIFMIISGLISILLPIILLVVFKKKGADILPFFVGCIVMLVFAFILESLVHSIILSSDAGTMIQGNVVLYALYGGIMAGLFEETGRFLAFKTVLKKRQDKNINALMYGAGHGGFEAVALLGITSLNNVIWSFMINSGNTAALTGAVTGDALAQVEAAIQALITTPSYMFLLGGIERISAIILHIALSVLVWFAAKTKGAGYLYPVAILIHFAVDAMTVILSGYGTHAILLEAIVAVMSILAAVYAKNRWNRYHNSQ